LAVSSALTAAPSSALSPRTDRSAPQRGQSYPATERKVPALAVNTTVAMKITASVRDKVHALGMRMASVPTRAPCG
jgi:hypothetical protein